MGIGFFFESGGHQSLYAGISRFTGQHQRQGTIAGNKTQGFWSIALTSDVYPKPAI